MPGIARHLNPTNTATLRRNDYGPKFSDVLRRAHGQFIEVNVVVMTPASVRAMAQLPAVKNDPSGLLKHIIGSDGYGDRTLPFQVSDRDGLVELARSLGGLDRADADTRSGLADLGRAAAAHFRTSELDGVDDAMVRAFDAVANADPPSMHSMSGAGLYASDGSSDSNAALAAHALAGNVGSVTGPGMLEAPTVSDAVMSKIRGANQTLAIGLATALRDAGPNPVIASVLTLKQFAQLLPTFSDDAKQGLKQRLGWEGLSDKKIAEGVDAFVARMTNNLPAGVQVALADYLIGAQGSRLAPKFEENVARAGGTLEQKNFADPATVGFVNDLVSVATDGKIQDLLKPGAFDSSTSFALVSAINLDALWRVLFPGRGETFIADFLADGGVTVKTKMQQSTDQEFRVLDGPDFKAVAVPNGEIGEFATVYITPKHGDLGDWIAGLERDPSKLTKILDALNKQAPQVGAIRIPQTNVSFEPDADAFLEALRANGLPKVAYVTADGAPTALNSAAYKAKSEVDERKISAAAAQVISGSRGLPRPPREPDNLLFDVNRSSLQVITCGSDVLFFNPITNPAK